MLQEGLALGRARQKLGDVEFSRVWEAGRAVSVDEVAAYALDHRQGI